MADVGAITNGKYSIWYQCYKNILGEEERHKCANRRRNICWAKYEVALERNVNLEANLSVYLSLQFKKEVQTFIWPLVFAGALGATAALDDVAELEDEEAAAGAPP